MVAAGRQHCCESFLSVATSADKKESARGIILNCTIKSKQAWRSSDEDRALERCKNASI